MSQELERELVAALFCDTAVVLTLDIGAEDFLDPIHQRLWGIGLTAAQNAKPLTVAAIAKAWPALGGYVKSLVDTWGRIAPRREHLETLVAGIKDSAARSRLHDLALGLAQQSSDPEISPDELLAQFMGNASRVTARRRIRSKRALARHIAENINRPMPCYQTGITRLDEVLAGGLFAGKMIGISARKKVGKTVLLGTISHNLNWAEVKHGFLCLEMSDEEVEQRNIARQMGFNSVEFLTRRRHDLDRLAADYATLVPDFTVFEHMPGATFDQVRRAASQMVVNDGIKGLIIDYWQLIRGRDSGKSQEEHQGETAQWFADFCRKEGIFGIIAAQVNQQGNSRGGEGLKLACDAYFTLHREKDDDAAWLEMEDTRYTLYGHVGSEQQPGLRLNKVGPFFEDATAPAQMPEQTAGAELRLAEHASSIGERMRQRTNKPIYSAEQGG